MSDSASAPGSKKRVGVRARGHASKTRRKRKTRRRVLLWSKAGGGGEDDGSDDERRRETSAALDQASLRAFELWSKNVRLIKNPQFSFERGQLRQADVSALLPMWAFHVRLFANVRTSSALQHELSPLEGKGAGGCFLFRVKTAVGARRCQFETAPLRESWWSAGDPEAPELTPELQAVLQPLCAEMMQYHTRIYLMAFVHGSAPLGSKGFALAIARTGARVPAAPLFEAVLGRNRKCADCGAFERWHSERESDLVLARKNGVACEWLCRSCAALRRASGAQADTAGVSPGDKDQERISAVRVIQELFEGAVSANGFCRPAHQQEKTALMDEDGLTVWRPCGVAAVQERTPEMAKK